MTLNHTKEQCIEWLRKMQNSSDDMSLPANAPLINATIHHLTPPATPDGDWDLVNGAVEYANKEWLKMGAWTTNHPSVMALDRLRLSDLAKDEAIAGMAVAIKNQYATIAEQDKAIERLREELAEAQRGRG